MQEVIDKCGRGYSTQGLIRTLFGQLDHYAMELDVIEKMNSNLIHAASVPSSNKVPFTEEEIQSVWDIECQEWCDSVLFLLYTGFRIGEMLTIEKENVDLEQMTVKGGLKTTAGKNRIVPIHPRIQKFVEERMTEDGSYLFSHNRKKLSTTQYYVLWNKIMDKLKMPHTPHECRHTFRSRLDSAGANKVCIDLMMGHKSQEVGERVYTHKTIEELRETLNLIK